MAVQLFTQAFPFHMFNYNICLASQLFLKKTKKKQLTYSTFILQMCVQVPGDMAELHSYTLGHAPLFREHAAVLLLIVH